MSWEIRRGIPYYYQKRRVDGHVSSTYIGRGPHAETIAAQDQAEQAARVVARAELVELQAAWKAEDRVFADLRTAADTVATATLLLNGFHMHKGQWRHRRRTNRWHQS